MLQLHPRTLLWLNIESQRKIGEEIVARHLKEEEKINRSLDHDLDQETDQFHTIEKNQRDQIIVDIMNNSWNLMSFEFNAIVVFQKNLSIIIF